MVALEAEWERIEPTAIRYLEDRVVYEFRTDTSNPLFALIAWMQVQDQIGDKDGIR